jgi:Bifunctional DNA primase/polymerase, N-terminal
MSRPSPMLRVAALGYASQGIPVLPLHYPLPHRVGVQPVGGDRQLRSPAVGMGCSCRDPGCGQVGKHPLGSLVPHGLHEATTNRARVMAWWTRHPQAMRTFAGEHALHSAGPLVRTGGGGWHYYLAPTGLGNVHPHGLERVDWRGRGGYVVAPPSRHASGHPYQWVSGRDLDTSLAEVPVPLLERLHRQLDRPVVPTVLLPLGDGSGHRYGQAALAQELTRIAIAPRGQRNQQLWEAARNLYNLVAGGVLDDHQVHQGLLQAAERCGLLTDEPHQTQRTLASGRQVGLVHPRPAPDRTRSDPTRASPPPPARPGGERTQEGR